jgi:hypothetical protein
MIDCAGLAFSVGSARMNSLLQKATASCISLNPTSANLNAVPRTMSNSSIAYLTGTMHDGKRIPENGRGDEHNQQRFKAPDSPPSLQVTTVKRKSRPAAMYVNLKRTALTLLRRIQSRSFSLRNKRAGRLICQVYGVAMSGINSKKLLWAIR